MKLDIFEDAYEYHIAWSDEDGEGLALGEKADDDEHKAATNAAKQIGEPSTRRSDGRLSWESFAAAKKARAAANAAVKQHRAGKPWPDWALRARAEGWKPPKGWQPT